MDAEWSKNDQDKLKEDASFRLNKTPECKVVTFVNLPSNLTVYNDKRQGVIVVAWKKPNTLSPLPLKCSKKSAFCKRFVLRKGKIGTHLSIWYKISIHSKTI